MDTLCKITGLNKLISFYRYIYFNQPRLVTATGVGLILLVGLIHLLEASEHFEAAVYVGVLFLANFVGSVVAAIGIFRGARGWGWLLGASISCIALLAYLVSRALGLPGRGEYVGAWSDPVGSTSVLIEVLFVGLYLSLVTGMNIAYPGERNWYD
jgi:hypothetical protein